MQDDKEGVECSKPQHIIWGAIDDLRRSENRQYLGGCFIGTPFYRYTSGDLFGYNDRECVAGDTHPDDASICETIKDMEGR